MVTHTPLARFHGPRLPFCLFALLPDTAAEGGGGNLGLALFLATLSGLTTGLGGLLVVLPNMRSFGEYTYRRERTP